MRVCVCVCVDMCACACVCVCVCVCAYVQVHLPLTSFVTQVLCMYYFAHVLRVFNILNVFYSACF